MKKKSSSSRFSRRDFVRNTGLTSLGLLFIPPYVFGSDHIRNKWVTSVPDMLRANEGTRMNGFIGRKLDLSYQNRILAQDADHLIEPFRHRTETRLWQSEFWGKWFTSAVLAYRYHSGPELKKILQSAVNGLLSTQTADGYIGNYKAENRLEQWDIWGRKYCLLGLLDYYELAKDRKALDAAKRLADHLIKEINDRDGVIVNKGNYRGMAASSVLEPMVRLYNVTGNKAYLSFAQKIVDQWETPKGPMLISKADVNVSERFPKPENWYSPEQGQKAYEMMSCYEGLLELYRVTGNKSYKKAVERTWENIRDTEINIAGSGASEEMWFGGKKRQTHPVAHYQETCVTVTWIKLNQQLLRLTGEAKYADEIERSYYNALMGALNGDASDWAKYTPLNGERLPGSGQCGMNLNCCNASGARGQFTLPFTTVMSMNAGLSVNFYVDGSYDLRTPSGKRTKLIQKTDYPLSGTIVMNLEMEGTEEFMFRFRIPVWSKRSRLTVNDHEVSGITPGNYMEVKRSWSSKDVIKLELDVRGRVEMQDDGKVKFAAIMKGPVVLARDSRLGGRHLNTVNRPVADKEGFVELTPAVTANKDEYWMIFTASFVPESYTETGAEPIAITLIDYASAGNGKEKSTFQVWMPQLYSGRD